jgi:hypothetical protein
VSVDSLSIALVLVPSVCSLTAWGLWLRFNRKMVELHGPKMLDRTPMVARSFRRFGWSDQQEASVPVEANASAEVLPCPAPDSDTALPSLVPMVRNLPAAPPRP